VELALQTANPDEKNELEQLQADLNQLIQLTEGTGGVL
jgi:hypothetical protein